MGVGMPAEIELARFGDVLIEAFGEMPYLVGSALRAKTWRDVDVRLLLPDDKYERLFGALLSPRCLNARWNAYCLAFTALGRRMTGLPIDFQIDQLSAANREYAGQGRSALFSHDRPHPFSESTDAPTPDTTGDVSSPPSCTCPDRAALLEAVEAASAALLWMVGADYQIDSEWGDGSSYEEADEITALREALQRLDGTT